MPNESTNIMYYHYPEDEGIHFYPHPTNKTILFLKKVFSPDKPRIENQKIINVISAICEACPALHSCWPRFTESLMFRKISVTGERTHDPICKLGKNGGAFIPVQHFLKNKTT